jgi:hypothetical protein
MDIDKINKLIMLNNLNSVLAQIKDESEEGETGNQSSTNSTQTGPAPGPADDQTHGTKTDSPPESAQRPAPGSHANTAPRSKSAQNPTTSSGKLKMKTPRFDYQLPIENWLSAMELYMSCHDLSEEDIITASLAQLLTEGSGSNVIESIGKEERKNWEAFKSKLIEVLGKDQEHFKHLYNTFQHGGESQAMALTKLTAFFKKGYKKTDLDDADKSIVCEKFIDAQQPRLRELLTREKSFLNLRNIAQRATELEQSLFKKESIFTAKETQSPQSEVSELCSQLRSIVSGAIKDQKKPQNKKGRVDTKKIEGHCIRFVRKGKCNFGSKCRYLHSDDIPKHIRDIIMSKE